MAQLVETTGDNGDPILIRTENITFIENRFANEGLENECWVCTRIHFLSGSHVDCGTAMDVLTKHLAG